MRVKDFVKAIGSEFFVGVPDSKLKHFCNYLECTYGINNEHHVIGANEGNCVAIAAGYHLATGKVPVVYMQNSGEGNAVNPILSMTHNEIYGIPMIFVIGWRGEEGVKDEPQHLVQGRVTTDILDVLGITYSIIDSSSTFESIKITMEYVRDLASKGCSFAFVVRDGAFESDIEIKRVNDMTIVREKAIEEIAKAAGNDVIVCTTGKSSRELYEVRERNGMDHSHDFLTVGSMGHASSIALGLAISKPDMRVWCIDGDGAALMHLGAMTTISAVRPKNLIHIVLNNMSHESVGGTPTAGKTLEFSKIANAIGYKNVVRVSSGLSELEIVLEDLKKKEGPSFLEIMCNLESRKDLGRPKTTPIENKDSFKEYISKC